MQGLYVHVKGEWPAEAFLQMWGRATVGWYGLIAWDARVRLHGTLERITLAGWVPAARLGKPHYVPAKQIQRVELASNRLDWPAPVAVDCDYFLGAWDDGPARLPAGMKPDVGPAWRRESP